ncbi:ribokinase [Methylobacillus caricis]|uniref:ribokinase n=1 Tax=Methylobacillus caricis TaxID=1971611 RepID=UPI001CFFF7AF|nr:ribokinase [Methylobacillus caricis]MCB5188616.1 ribokinase [Methylobacillus caricis]
MLASFIEQRSQNPRKPPSAFVLASLMVAHVFFVRRFPSAGESVKAERFYCEIGGKGLNVLVGLHKLGTPVDGIIPVGNNPAAQLQYLETLQKWELHTPELLKLGEHNGTGVALINDTGQNEITLYPGANALLDPSHIRAHASRITQADIVYASFETPAPAITETFLQAKHAGRLTILNPSPFHSISPVLLASTDVLIMNQTEAAEFFHVDANTFHHTESARLFLNRISFNQLHPGKSLVLTLSSEGAITILENGQFTAHPAFRTEAIDSIGAGDAFASAFLHMLLSGQSIEKSMQAGCASASIVIGTSGLLHHLPTNMILNSFIENHPPISPGTQ